MGIIDNIKAATKKFGESVAKRLKDVFVPRIDTGDDDDAPPPAVDTSRYLHVSVGLSPIESPELRRLLGRRYFKDTAVGHTRNVGNNLMKRVADGLGSNNKERRRIRTRMKRRAAELRAGAPLRFPSIPSEAA